MNIKSLWELILFDDDFTYPNYHSQTVIVQDCWRAKDRTAEQNAVRELLRKMNFEIHELPNNRENTDFCGEKVVSYCHYCLEGLKLGGADATHLAGLLFNCDL